MYFNMELAILESIWAATDNAWTFSFDHRNDIENQIGGSLDSMMEQMFQMQQEDLDNMMREAESSLEHIQAVIDKYKNEIARFLTVADASVTVQEDLIDRLKLDAGSVQNEVEDFEDAVDQWKHEQEVKAAWGIFKAVVGIFQGFVTGYFDPAAIGDAIETAIQGALDIAEMIQELMDVLESVGDIKDMIDGIDIGGLDDIGVSMSTEFKVALQSAVDLKRKGPEFDELKNLARVKLDAINHDIEDLDATDLMMAIQNLCDVSQRLTGEVAEFADNMLMLAERYDEIEVANSDKERAVAEVENINKMIEDLIAAKAAFEEKREQDKQDYEDELRKMEEEYANMSAELREEYKRIITEKFDNFKAGFEASREAYVSSLSELTDSVQRKSYGLKEHSMLQRSMLLSLYTDYCDAKFYHSFMLCSMEEAPLMSDDFELLLQKLDALQWDSITSTSNLPGTPIKFGYPNPVWLTLQDQPLAHNYPIQLLKNNSKLEVNLKDYDVSGNFERFWRVRIDMIRLVLLDTEGGYIDSPGTQFGDDIQVLVTYPTLFTDTDQSSERYLFLAQDFVCTSDYTTIDNSEPEFHSQCQVDSEFSHENYKPSSDGIFTFHLANSGRLDMEQLHSVKLEFSGSYIPHYRGQEMQQWIF